MTETSETTKDLKTELQKSVELLKTLREKARATLQGAGKDAKEGWSKVEPHLAEVERAAREATRGATAASRTAVSGAVATLKNLRDSMK
jgi:hypothetical protein